MQVLCVINFLFLFFFFLSCMFVTVMVTVKGKLLCVNSQHVRDLKLMFLTYASSKSEPCVRSMRRAATVMRNSSSRSSENIPAGIASSFCIRVVKHQRHSHMFTVLAIILGQNWDHSLTAHFSNNINFSPVKPVDVLKLWVFVLWCFGQEACPE